MKSKAKPQPRKKPAARSKRQAAPAKKPAKEAVAKKTQASPSKQEFARFIWPSIKDTTKFLDVPEFQGTVRYALPSGEQVTATLKWYTVSRGPRILGYYDDENDVCYIAQFIE